MSRALWKLAVAGGAVAALFAAGPAMIQESFDRALPDRLAAGLRIVRSPARSWTVRAEGENRVLAQEGTVDSESVVIIEGTSFRDVAVSGRAKGISGRRIQGFVWRYKDPRNFLVVRSGGDADGAEIPEVRTDLYFRGKRIPLGGNQKVAGLKVDDWHTLRVEHRGARIQVFLGRVKVSEVYDEHWCRLLDGPGAVGFFTKGSQAQFDDFSAEELGPEPR